MKVRLDVCPPVITTPVGHRILAAAGRLFYERGIVATGVDRVVEEAGTTKRTLYQRFGSKDALVAAYLQQRAHRWQSELLHALAESGSDSDPARSIDVVHNHAMRWAQDGGRGCAFVNAWAEIGGSGHEALAVIQAEKAWMHDLFTQIVGGDGREGTILYLLYEGAQVTAAIRSDPDVFDTARTASRHFLARRAHVAQHGPPRS